MELPKDSPPAPADRQADPTLARAGEARALQDSETRTMPAMDAIPGAGERAAGERAADERAAGERGGLDSVTEVAGGPLRAPAPAGAAGAAGSADPGDGLPEEFPAGSLVDDFLIVRQLGLGAFARVYLARQISMQRLVALKVSRGTGAESLTLAQLDHENIVRVYDQRFLPDSRLHLLYMQYVPGGTLVDVITALAGETLAARTGETLLLVVDRRLLDEAQQVPEWSTVRRWLKDAEWPVVVAWMGVQLARALDAAHRRGILHRDVKPANVLLTAEGVPKLADFNISAPLKTGSSGGSASIGGSLAYMSPEHLQALLPASSVGPDDVRERADLYSLGVLLWELWQGHRPFACPPVGSGMWSDVVRTQLASRRPEPSATRRRGGGAERVLEQTLRRVLAPSAEDRPASGGELAGRLRLALHPETAGLFDPERGSVAGWLLRRSPLGIAAVVILVPNIAAGVFNYCYNWVEIITKWRGTPGEEIIQGFWGLAMAVNSVAYPLGAGLMIWMARPMVRSLVAAWRRLPAEPAALAAMMALGHRAAWIGGALWGAASVIYPVALSVMYPWFPLEDAIHFFLSLLVCGGIAAVYPYFGMTVIATRIYYPHLMRISMQDPSFESRRRHSVQQSGRFLLAAAGIPLLALALLLSLEEQARWVMAWAVAATALGLVAAFRAYQCIERTWALMANVLAPPRSPLE